MAARLAFVLIGLIAVGLALVARETLTTVASVQGSVTATGSTVDWTSQPKRIDQLAATLPRVAAAPVPADPYPLLVEVPETVQTPDNSRFRWGSSRFRLGNIEPLAANAICTGVQGRRWACGARLRIALRALIVGSILRCRLLEETAGEKTVECLAHGATLTRDMEEEATMRSEPSLAPP